MVFFQAALAQNRNDDTPKHEDNRCRTYVSAHVAEKMLPVYKRMSDDNLLKRMMHGQTQNQNECFNSTIWLRCPHSKG